MLKSGFNAETVLTGEAAYKQIKDTPGKYEFILMDCELGNNGWDGFKATREILKINNTLSIILFSNKTTLPDEVLRFRALSAGALRYAKKGTAPELSSLIESLATEVKTLKALHTRLNAYTEKQQWLQSSLFASRIGITIIDRTYRIHYMNHYQQNLVGAAAGHALFCYQLFPGLKRADSPCKHCTVKDIFSGKKLDAPGTLHYLPVQGEWQYLQVFASPLQDNQGKVVMGNDGKPIAVILSSRLLDKQSAGQFHYMVRLKAIIHALWQVFDRVRLYHAAPDLKQLKIIDAAGHAEEFGKIYDLSADPCGKWCLQKRQPRIWNKSSDYEAMSELFSGKIKIAALNQWLDYPLFKNEEVIGWFSADNAVTQSPINMQNLNPGIATCCDEIIKIFSSPDFDQKFGTKPGNASQVMFDIDIKLATEAYNPGEGLGILIEEIKKGCRADYVYIRYLKGDKLILMPAPGDYQALAGKEVLLTDNNSLSALAARRGEAVFIPETEKDNDFLKLKAYYERERKFKAAAFSRVKAAIYYPVKLGTAIVGIIGIYSFSKKDYTTENRQVSLFLKEISQKMAHLINSYVPFIKAETEKQRFEKLLEAIGDEVNIINQKDIITFVNAVKRAKFEKPGENLMDGSHVCWQTFEKRNTRCTRCSCTIARITKKIARMRSIAYDKNEKPYVVKVTASPLILPDGSVDEVIEICRDITQALRKKRELKVVDDLSQYTAKNPEIEVYLTEACKKIKELIPAQECSLFLWDADRQRLELKASTANGYDPKNRTQSIHYFYKKVTTRHFVHFLEGIPIRGEWSELKSSAEPEIAKFERLYGLGALDPLTHYLHVPLKIFDKDDPWDMHKLKMPLGMIEVINKIVPDREGYCMERFRKPFRLDPAGFTDTDTSFLNKLGVQISLWVHNQQLLAQRKEINDKMESLALTVAAIAQSKNREELAYLTLRAATHQEGLSNFRAFLLLPPLGESRDYAVYAIGAKNNQEAETIWSRKKTDFKKMLEEFKKQGIPGGIFWNTRDFRVNEEDLKKSFLVNQTMKENNKIRIFGHLKDTHSEPGSKKLEDLLTPFEKNFFNRIEYGDEIGIALFPVTETEYGVLMVDNKYSDKQIRTITRYLLTQYAHRLSAVIQRWYTIENFKLLAAQAGHEIRGALQSIVSYNALYKCPLSPEQVTKAQQQIAQEANRARDIVSASIEHAKAESRYWVLKKIATPLVSIIAEAVLSMAPEAAKEEIRIILHKGNRLLIPVDPEKMRMVILNLLRNAMRAIPRGLPQERKQIDIGYKNSRKIGQIIITIKDRGTGITPGELGKIFEPFRGTGTGLGLSLARQIVERHGGRIKVQSTVNKGTVLFIFLPEE